MPFWSLKKDSIIECLVIGLLVSNTACSQVQRKQKDEKMDAHQYTNELIHESSPYLLQHAHNPVDWYPWGEKALKKAREENKLVIVSIGYAACHWCHVMEHECYEDTTVARVMNEHFVCIKVDREERPDIDQVYMHAAYLVSGNGGWPLNAFALPDGRPFYAGTYFPKENWLQLLNYFIGIQHKNPAMLNEQAEEITRGIQSSETPVLTRETTFVTLSGLNELFNTLKTHLDYVNGGEKRAPKFPMPADWEFLMHYYSLSHNQDALSAVTTTLDKMAFGGIYDQVGGGFARYSTDTLWQVPHFEKMLYDNGQLVSLYTHAWQLTKNDLYRKVVYETLSFVEHEMRSPEGGFYSSIDADSEGEEGKFYAWTSKEIHTIVGEDAAIFSDYYTITQQGNWENGKNILFRKLTDEECAQKYGISVASLKERMNRDIEKLKKAQSLRARPGLDDKILTSWNAIMLSGFIQAYRAFGDEKFLNIALKNAAFLDQHAISKSGEITRNYKNGHSTIPGLLDDYAFTISAFIQLYQATFDEQWLNKARTLCDSTRVHFFDSRSGMFYYTSNLHADLIARKMEIADNVIPSSNSEMAMNLYLLGLYYDNPTYTAMSRQMLVNIQSEMYRNIYYYANWGRLALLFIREPDEVAIEGNDWLQFRAILDKHYLPSVIFLGGAEEGRLPLLENKFVPGKTIIYVCRNKTCKLPVTDPELALQQLR